MTEDQNTSPTKKDKSKILNLFYALFNFILLLYIIITIHSNIILTSLSILLIIVLLGGLIITVSMKNPYYMIFCLGIIGCSIFFIIMILLIALFSGFQTSLFEIILFVGCLTEIVYLIYLSKQLSTGSQMGSILYQVRAGAQYSINAPDFERMWDQREMIDDIEKKKKKDIRKKHKQPWILIVTVFCVIAFYITYILSASLQF